MTRYVYCIVIYICVTSIYKNNARWYVRHNCNLKLCLIQPVYHGRHDAPQWETGGDLVLIEPCCWLFIHGAFRCWVLYQVQVITVPQSGSLCGQPANTWIYSCLHRDEGLLAAFLIWVNVENLCLLWFESLQAASHCSVCSCRNAFGTACIVVKISMLLRFQLQNTIFFTFFLTKYLLTWQRHWIIS